MRALLAVLLLLGCAERAPTLKVGAKAFGEQEILAEMLVAVARNAGQRAKVERCVDTWACSAALRGGAVDLMVEYTGTGLNFLGARPEARSLADLRRISAPLKLRWLDPLGFDNSYALVVRKGAGSIADLAGRPALRVAAPAAYLRRPRDGLAALGARYGLSLAKPVIIEAPDARYAALGEGRVDVVIGYTTDPHIQALGLKVLADPLAFFPPYEGSVLLREEVAAAQPELLKALQTLSGRIDNASMRALNGQLALGRTPAEIARGFLAEQKLISPSKDPKKRRAQLVLAVAKGDALGEATRLAQVAARQAFPDRSLAVSTPKRPRHALATGAARLAVVGGERLFKRGQRAPDAAAVIVLGRRQVHLLRRGPGAPLAGRVGVGPRHSGAGIIGAAMLKAAGLRPAKRAAPGALLAALEAGRLDGVILLASAPDKAAAKALASGAKLVSLEDWLNARRATALPYLRPARIPPGAYPGAAQALDTLEAQVLLAAPRARVAAGSGRGPGAALPTGALPLTRVEIEALSRAAPVPEGPDPNLPTAWQDSPAGPAEAQESSFGEALANLLLGLFLAWLVWITIRPEEMEEAS